MNYYHLIAMLILLLFRKEGNVTFLAHTGKIISIIQIGCYKILKIFLSILSYGTFRLTEF